MRYLRIWPRRSPWLLLAVLSLLLAGCVQPSAIVKYEGQAAGIKSIAIVPISFPAQLLFAQNVPTPGALAAEASLREARLEQYTQIMSPFPTSAARELLTRTLVDALGHEGLTVSDSQQPRSDVDYLPSYPTDPTNPPDAYLDIVVMQYGYLESGFFGGKFAPLVAAKARLIRASDKKVLMERTIDYDPSTVVAPRLRFLVIRPEPQAYIATFDDFVAHPDGVRDRLKKGLVTIGEAVADLLK